MPISKKISFILIIFLYNVLLMFGAAELYFRFFFDASDQFNFIKTSRRWVDRHVETNSMGARDKQYDAIDLGVVDKEKYIRVGFVGDSLTYGQGVENTQDRYTELACASLRKKIPNIRCYNLGYPRSTTKDELEFLKKSQTKLPPFDLIVVQFFVNDIEGYAPFREILISDTELGKLMRRMRSFPKNPVAAFVLRHSYAAEFLYFQYLKKPEQSQPSYLEITKELYADQEKWQSLARSFDALKEHADTQGIPTGVLLFPTIENNPNSYSFEFAHQKVRAHLDMYPMPYRDLTATLQSYPANELITNRFDSHPNEKAHQLVAPEAEALVIQLLKKKARQPTASAKFKSLSLE